LDMDGRRVDKVLINAPTREVHVGVLVARVMFPGHPTDRTVETPCT
jgi:hypothetical protein